jgi:hypothetical protein
MDNGKTLEFMHGGTIQVGNHRSLFGKSCLDEEFL